MSKIWAAIVEKLKGRKTYVLSVVVCVAGVVLVAVGRVTPTQALSVGLVVAGLFSATFRAALEQHHQQAQQVLEEIAVAGAALAAHNVDWGIAAGLQAVKDGAALDTQIEAEVPHS